MEKYGVEDKELPPGSAAARSRGCTCPVVDNGHGRGCDVDEHGTRIFVYRGDCPLHGEKALGGTKHELP